VYALLFNRVAFWVIRNTFIKNVRMMQRNIVKLSKRGFGGMLMIIEKNISDKDLC